MFYSILCAVFCLSSMPTRVTSCDGTLPVVDLSDPDAAFNLVDAMQSWGFSYVKGHNIDEEIIKTAEEHTKRFFQLPSRVKRQLRADRSRALKTARGFTGLRGEKLDVSASGRPDLKEVFDVAFVNKTANNKRQKRHYLGENKWPSNNKDLANAIELYAENSAAVAQTVLQLLAEGLGSKGAFDDAFGEDALQVQRLTRYPPSNDIGEVKQGEIGSGTHSDYGGVTVLHANGPGLQVLRPNRTSLLVDRGTFSPELEVPHSGEWVEVESRPGMFIVMGGEALQRLSNGLVFAAKHKVDLTGDKERLSLVFFFDPRPDAVLEPIEKFRYGSKALYKAKLAGHKGATNNQT
eukprot:GFUD01036746.1.p1 GENE.GFUD01036746.1~~GFUD01036746.1.p1  ORF type:complete len:349 (-),score=78.25 GFUD01036746.1:153-1199(-)